MSEAAQLIAWHDEGILTEGELFCRLIYLCKPGEVNAVTFSFASASLREAFEKFLHRTDVDKFFVISSFCGTSRKAEREIMLAREAGLPQETRDAIRLWRGESLTYPTWPDWALEMCLTYHLVDMPYFRSRDEMRVAIEKALEKGFETNKGTGQDRSKTTTRRSSVGGGDRDGQSHPSSREDQNDQQEAGRGSQGRPVQLATGNHRTISRKTENLIGWGVLILLTGIATYFGWGG